MSSGRLTAGFGLLLAVWLTGCSTVHQVTVDAISAPGKALGASYHLEVNDPTGGVNPAAHAAAVTTIKDALGARGLYEIPAGVRPDMEIEASYGTGHGYVRIVTEPSQMAMMGAAMVQPNSKAVVVYDKTLELTARDPAGPAATSTPRNRAKAGDELWSVKAKITDTRQEMGSYLPALASACIDYIGENPGRELTLPIDTAHMQTLRQPRPAPPASP